MKVLIIAGTTSGAGKSMIAVGLIRALSERGLTVQPFKIGPDLQDPLLLSSSSQRRCVNLDGWLLNKEQNIKLFNLAMVGADVGIIEGNMGLFDGKDGKSECGSTAEISKWLQAPIILVSNCSELARSIAALLNGYLEFDKDVPFGGVILNQILNNYHCSQISDALTTCQLPIIGKIKKVRVGKVL